MGAAATTIASTAFTILFCPVATTDLSVVNAVPSSANVGRRANVTGNLDTSIRGSAVNVGRQDVAAWDESPKLSLLSAFEGRCDFPRVSVNDSVRAALRAGRECARPSDDCLGLGVGWSSRPWLFEGLTQNAHLQGPLGAAGKLQMLRNFRERHAVLSDAVAQSFGRKRVRFDVYVERLMRPPENLSVALDTKAGSTWYLCNDNLWDAILAQYDRSPMLRGRKGTRGLSISDVDGALSFGVGRTGSGLPFHVHGAQFAEVSHGQKVWFAAPFTASMDLNFSPTTSSLSWLFDNLDRGLPNSVLVCTQRAGETIYIPPMWWHATLNIGETFFFLDFVNGR
eukprot:TRINITY_DN48637_c0_g1_i1.p1 TRINITY_DN48637_c0_g1~~TRINITY_DN48637_c0_g1_i1.p1  ORF type:complete len:350 (+),score=40.96 TRINITY_DN48637_c0_g1_i1:35-1051(+)